METTSLLMPDFWDAFWSSEVLWVVLAGVVLLGALEITSFVMKLVLSSKHGLSGEQNPRLKALFWVTIGALVGACIPFLGVVLAIGCEIAGFVLVCISAFGKERYKMAKTIFILDLIDWILGIAFIVLVIVLVVSGAFSIFGDVLNGIVY